MVGGMVIHLSVLLCFKSKKIFCLDGDGSVLMHLGALRTIDI